MPKENKNRGRREEKKQKRKAEADDDGHNKRQKPDEETSHDTAEVTAPKDVDYALEGINEEVTNDRPFYGMLEDEEQEYFRRADELLELNDFPSPEERKYFLDNVFKEADGKELKIACSQSCSRLMERLILLSNVQQKKNLFGQFKDNFPHLVQHRFASHCCEMLFIQSANVVTLEMSGEIEMGEGGESELQPTMEALFLETLDELEGNMTSLLTDRFASHTLRVLLTILSGRPLDKSSTTSLLQSKRKEKVSISNNQIEISLKKRAVPESFAFAINKIISDTVATMDESFIKILATHESGNPTLQLLLELELTSKSQKVAGQKTILSVLLPDDIAAENSASAIFINGLMYEAIGSRLLETLCTFVPGKVFKQIYRTIFKDRIASLARNEIASYVVIKVITRLSKDDLEEAVTSILPQIPGLIERNRTVIVKVFLERCHARNINTAALTDAITTAYGAEPTTLLLKMASIDDLSALTAAIFPPPPPAGQENPPNPPQLPNAAPAQLHGSLLAQAMLSIPGPPTTALQNSILALPPSTLLTLALFTPTSHLLQSALLPSPANLLFRRKLIGLLLSPSSVSSDPVYTLADSKIGTHILDALLLSAPSLFMYAERIAASLLGHEDFLRNSFTGRIMWRNWSMDLYKRRRNDWVTAMKSQTLPEPPTPAPAAAAKPEQETEAVAVEKTEFSTAPISAAEARKNKKAKKAARNKKEERVVGVSVSVPNDGKTALQRARERFVEEKARKERMKGSKGTGVNAIEA